jgi:hypothetical protein
MLAIYNESVDLALNAMRFFAEKNTQYTSNLIDHSIKQLFSLEKI